MCVERRARRRGVDAWASWCLAAWVALCTAGYLYAMTADQIGRLRGTADVTQVADTKRKDGR